MTFTAVCHLCGYKQRVPEEFSKNSDAAKKWAVAWEDRHLKEVDHGNIFEEGSEAKA